jgi:hypothetical protein
MSLCMQGCIHVNINVELTAISTFIYYIGIHGDINIIA